MLVKTTKKVFIFGKLHDVGSKLDVTKEEYSENCMIKESKPKKEKAPKKAD